MIYEKMFYFHLFFVQLHNLVLKVLLLWKYVTILMATINAIQARVVPM